MYLSYNFPTSLFDFDFDAEREAKRQNKIALERWAVIEKEMITARLDALRLMAERANLENRLEAYFRLLDEIEAYEAQLAEECLTD